MMPTTDLNERLTVLGRHLDSERTLRSAPPPALIGGLDPPWHDAADSRAGAPGARPRWPAASLGRVAALLVVGVMAVGLVTARGGEEPRGITVRAATGAAGEIVGLYPIGDAQAVLDADFDEPVGAAAAYLDDRVAHAPAGVVLTADVGLTRLIDDGRAIVEFSLIGVDDSGDGYVLVERVGAGPGAWAVVSSSIISVEVPSISYQGGSVECELSTQIGGSTFVEVYDAATGALLDRTEVIQASGDGGTSRFSFTDIHAPAVAVRFWNVGDLERQAGPRATFAEVRLYDGDRDVDAGWRPLADASDRGRGT